MATVTFNPQTLAASYDWNTAGNWLPAVVPDATTIDAVTPLITSQSGTPYQPVIVIGTSESEQVGSLNLTDTELEVMGTLAIAGDLILSGETVSTGSQSNEIVDGGLLTIGGNIDVPGGGCLQRDHDACGDNFGYGGFRGDREHRDRRIIRRGRQRVIWRRGHHHKFL